MKPKKILVFFVIASLLILVNGCALTKNNQPTTGQTFTPATFKKMSYKHGTYYEIFVRSFADSNGDGIGDLNGVTQKLSYLKKLGVQGIWLMPIFQSPSYHGYDVTNYYKINPQYGTTKDLQNLVKQAHKDGIKVLLDLPINDTSNQNPWFQKALKGNKKYRNYYIWKKPSDDPSQIGDWGQQVWQGSGKNTYEGIFANSMPDLNYDNPAVRQQMIKIGQYWLKNAHIDGYRLDAALHIYSKWQYKNAAQKNYQWWTQFYNAMKKVKPKTYLVGEVWDHSNVIAPYLKSSLTSAFDFDLSSLLIGAAKAEGDDGIVDQLTGIRQQYAKQNPDFVDSTFITNHDMNRTMSQLNGNVNDAKMAASLLLTLPGNPFIYYGEEIGMTGSGPDQNKREPFIWSSNLKNSAQTIWEPIGTNKPSKMALNVEQKNPNSLYNWYKNLIYARRSSLTLSEGSLQSTNYAVDGSIIFKRNLKNKSMLVINNMSNSKAQIKLTKQDLNKYRKVYFATSKIKISAKMDIPAYSTVILEN